MKKYLASLLLLFSLPLAATPVLISDGYWGGNDQGYGDVIGSSSSFGISGMNVELVGSILTVSINTMFASNGLGSFSGYTYDGNGIGFGDLFLSANGWSPSGSAPYSGDDNASGEVWEYGISLDNRWSWTSGASLYLLGGSNADNALLTEEFMSGATFRNGQETAVDTASSTTTWLSNAATFGATANTVDFSLDISGTSLANASSIGLHWNMTCGNDTIEGEYNVPSVPEPAGLALMLLGLVCLTVFGQRRKQALMNNGV